MRDELREFGMPFPLYKGSLKSVSGLTENSYCVVCANRRRYLFKLSLHDHILDPCRSCGELVGLGIGWLNKSPEPTTCHQCGEINPWPVNRPRDGTVVCYDCLRIGRAAIAHETEVGIIDFPHALRGMTWFGDPEVAHRENLKTSILKTYNDGSTSIGVHLPKELLLEMLHTPQHFKLQREYWPYHCHGFMAYLGQWQQEDFEQQAPGRGREWFGEHMSSDDPWEDMWEWLPGEMGLSYVYQCLSCGRHQVFVDSD